MIVVMSGPFFRRIEDAMPRGSVRVIELGRDQALFRQGDAPPGLPLLHGGRIAMIRWTEAGRSVRIHVAGAGETFAEASLFANACHCDAIAEAPSVVRLLPRAEVLDVFARRPDLARSMTEHLAHQLMRARRLLELRAITPLARRLLVRLEELAGPDGRLPPHVRLISVAADLGVTPPALYRALARLEAAGDLDRPARGQVRLRPNESGRSARRGTSAHRARTSRPA